MSYLTIVMLFVLGYMVCAALLVAGVEYLAHGQRRKKDLLDAGEGAKSGSSGFT